MNSGIHHSSSASPQVGMNRGPRIVYLTVLGVNDMTYHPRDERDGRNVRNEDVVCTSLMRLMTVVHETRKFPFFMDSRRARGKRTVSSVSENEFAVVVCATIKSGREDLFAPVRSSFAETVRRIQFSPKSILLLGIGHGYDGMTCQPEDSGIRCPEWVRVKSVTKGIQIGTQAVNGRWRDFGTTKLEVPINTPIDLEHLSLGKEDIMFFEKYSLDCENRLRAICRSQYAWK